MDDFFPLKLLDVNISSNEGLEAGCIELKQQLTYHSQPSRVILKVLALLK